MGRVEGVHADLDKLSTAEHSAPLFSSQLRFLHRRRDLIMHSLAMLVMRVKYPVLRTGLRKSISCLSRQSRNQQHNGMASPCFLIPEHVLRAVVEKAKAPQNVLDACQSTIDKTGQIRDKRIQRCHEIVPNREQLIADGILTLFLHMNPSVFL